jgi:hypothetical protein
VLIGALMPSAASARSCGSWDVETGRVEADGYFAATCTFAEATVDRFYAVDGVPRRMTVLGTVLVRRKQQRDNDWSMWLYDGRRHGRYLSVIITETTESATSEPVPVRPLVPTTPSTPSPAPTVNYPGRGSTVVCADGTISHSGGIQGACSWHGGIGG